VTNTYFIIIFIACIKYLLCTIDEEAKSNRCDIQMSTSVFNYRQLSYIINNNNVKLCTFLSKPKRMLYTVNLYNILNRISVILCILISLFFVIQEKRYSISHLF